ncbi:MAG: hypothetical protein M0R80_18385 [Proteobacteria bacterium]|jgi:hypothetical protein|nr:hypothetical protein [Pseudomonadota bacterium]
MKAYNFEICIPSMGRAGSVETAKLFDDFKIFCPKREADEYRKFYGDKVFEVPDDIKGITATRNFILDHSGKYVIQCDDDVIGFYRMNSRKENKYEELTKEHLYEVIDNSFLMAEEIETNLWGFNLSRDKKFYREYSPISLSSVLVANFFGMINDGQRFDERVKLKEDYDYSLESLRRHRKILRFNQYAFFVQHQSNSGGCVDYRTMDLEKDTIKLLKRKWGSKIIKTNPKKEYEIKVSVPIKGI